jgi:hypothetical protein
MRGTMMNMIAIALCVMVAVNMAHAQSKVAVGTSFIHSFAYLRVARITNHGVMMNGVDNNI